MAIKRCRWASTGDPFYEHYHDHEWGVPVHDDQRLFEFIILEGAQAGLSWLTILRKREAYRTAFASFDPRRVAQYNEADLARLMQNVGIVRNRLKLAASVTNAQKFLGIQREFGSFDTYQWQFVDGQAIQNTWTVTTGIPAITPQAQAFSADLKRRGFKFVGPTIMYAHMQAVGMVNDHTTDCFRYAQIQSIASS